MSTLRIKDLCEKRGISAAELSRLVGISPTTISNMNTGRISPHLTTLEKIAAALGVELWELFVSREEKDGTNFCAMVHSGANTHFIDSLDGLERLVARLREDEEIADKEEGK
ncbi:MAG: helix-turn-helix transcriptional regulator [Salinivirgaceae bacterium]|nr:helix-turn-helix transcriptional regulator [Salinivirgaceae bacterium]